MHIEPGVDIDESLLSERFVRAAGPGGQNVNKVATAVQLRFALEKCDTLDDDVKQRLRTLASTRLNRRGEIVITANRHRTQQRNRADARERLMRLIGRALVAPKKRAPPKAPSRAQKRQRVEDKRRHGSTKRERAKPRSDSY
jgi:ribosome-associated protein